MTRANSRGRRFWARVAPLPIPGGSLTLTERMGNPNFIGATKTNSFSIRQFQFIAPGGFMVAVQFRISRAGFLLAIALSLSFLSTAAHAYTPEQQQACSGDAFRLCGDAIPDVDRVTVCMIRNRSQLSPGCKVYFRGPEPVAARVTVARKPVRITPATG